MPNIPLSLYIHIPWCVQKCPYCDFNSHGQKGDALPESEYIAHLLHDLTQDSKLVGDRLVSTVFIGGGTPSLFSAQGIAQLLNGVKNRVNLANNAEITLEANPGTVEAERFKGYVDAGVTRFSIGIQSFTDSHLSKLGRIHNSNEANKAVNLAATSGVGSYNLDLMHGLPNQSIAQALDDLAHAIHLAPPHLSWYQLTLEPNTPFYSRPPELPDDDVLWKIQSKGHDFLTQAGYQQYEISGYSKPGEQCRHNLNYWAFGDYLGIGCGAHGKVSNPKTNTIMRTVKVKHPRGYMSLQRAYLDQRNVVSEEERAFEFFLNRFRLTAACLKSDFQRYTFTDLTAQNQASLSKVTEKGLLTETDSSWQVTSLGRRYLNSLLTEFV